MEKAERAKRSIEIIADYVQRHKAYRDYDKFRADEAIVNEVNRVRELVTELEVDRILMIYLKD